MSRHSEARDRILSILEHRPAQAFNRNALWDLLGGEFSLRQVSRVLASLVHEEVLLRLPSATRGAWWYVLRSELDMLPTSLRGVLEASLRAISLRRDWMWRSGAAAATRRKAARRKIGQKLRELRRATKRGGLLEGVAPREIRSIEDYEGPALVHIGKGDVNHLHGSVIAEWSTVRDYFVPKGDSRSMSFSLPLRSGSPEGRDEDQVSTV